MRVDILVYSQLSWASGTYCSWCVCVYVCVCVCVRVILTSLCLHSNRYRIMSQFMCPACGSIMSRAVFHLDYIYVLFGTLSSYSFCTV